MSYGLKFYNDSNQIVIDDNAVKPWFPGVTGGSGSIGQAQVTNVSDITASWNQVNALFYGTGAYNANRTWRIYRIRYAMPSGVTSFPVITLPNTAHNIWYHLDKPNSLPGDGYIDIIAYVPSETVAGPVDFPKVFAFVSDTIPISASDPVLQQSFTYGLKLFNQAGGCVFDSNKIHIQPYSIPDIYIHNSLDFVGPGYSSSSATVSLPSNPAFILPSVKLSGTYSNGTTLGVSPIIFTRVNNTIISAAPQAYTTSLSSSVPVGTAFNTDVTGLQKLIIVDSTNLDQGYVFPGLPATYSLTVNKSRIAEGDTGSGLDPTSGYAVFTLTTTGVANGTTVPFTISGPGITANDITPSTLTGYFTQNNNVGTYTISAINDGLAEGSETLTLSLNNGLASASVLIDDYKLLTLSASASTIEEGQSVLITLTTVGVSNGTAVGYSATAGGLTFSDMASDSAPLTGNFTVNNGTASLVFRLAQDYVYNENETLKVILTDYPGTSVTVNISEISTQYNESVSLSLGPVYASQTIGISVSNGMPNDIGKYVVADSSTTENDIYDYYTGVIKPSLNPSTIYLDESGNYFSSVTASTLGIGTKKIWYRFENTRHQRVTSNLTINPTPGVSVTSQFGAAPLTVNEGTTITFTVTTTNISNGTQLRGAIVNPASTTNADFTNDVSAPFTINNGTGSFTVSISNDLITEGDEYFNVAVTDMFNYRLATFGQVTVIDTSLTPATYTLTKSANSVNEGSYIMFSISTQNLPAGTPLYWNMSGTNFTVSDIGDVYYDYQDEFGWQFQPGIHTAGSITPLGSYFQIIVFPNADLTTEGNETVNFYLRTGSLSGTVVASTSFVINDTSVYPAAGTPNGSPYCVGFDKYQRYNDGMGGTYVSLVEANSSYCGFNAHDESTYFVSDDAYQDNIVALDVYGTLVVTGGEPNTTFTYSVLNLNDPQPTSFPGGPVTLDGNGSYTNYLRGRDITGGVTGSKKFWVKFAYNGHVRSCAIYIVENYGTPSGGQYCVGYSLQQNYWNGRGGTYSQTVQNNSPTCGYVQQYYPYMDRTYYYYHTLDSVYDLWYIYGAKPNSQVKFTITAGPAYVGANATVTTDADGFAAYNIGVAAYAAGSYTITATFPGQDASYPSGYRTLTFYWLVYADYGGSSGGY